MSGSSPRPPRSGPSLTFAAGVGLALGVLFAALVIPVSQRDAEQVALSPAGVASQPAAGAFATGDEGQPTTDIDSASADGRTDSVAGPVAPGTVGGSGTTGAGGAATTSSSSGSRPGGSASGAGGGGGATGTSGGAGGSAGGTAATSGDPSGQGSGGAAAPSGPDGQEGPGTGQSTGTDSTASPPPAGAATAQPDVRGVSADTIRIGVAVPRLGALANLGPNYDIGNPREHFEATLQRWRDTGRVPVRGRDVEFVYREFDVLNPDEQRAACVGFGTDDETFGVIGVSQFYAASECVTVEQAMPLITSLGHYSNQSAAAGRLLYDLQADMDRNLANFAHWAHDNGHLQGKTIGVYHGTGTDGVAILNGFLPALESLGYEVAERVTTDNVATGSPSDGVAVQRFNAAGVDLALLFVSAINGTNFMQQAEAQLYRPTYLQSDFITGTNDTAASTYPPSQFDGTYAMTQLRFGQEAGGYGLQPEAQACMDGYEAHSGRRVTYESQPAEWYVLQQGCDEAEIFMRGLENAGEVLTVDTFAAALDGLRAVPMGLHTDVSFLPDVSGGTHNLRTLQWRAGCTCFVAISDVRPFYVSGP